MKTIISVIPRHLRAALGAGLSLLLVSAFADSTSVSSAATRWTHGFEASEGYTAGKEALSMVVSVMDGTTSVVNGDASEGAQFLRFVPNGPDPALLIALPRAVNGSAERSIGFAVRLTAGPDTTRLVLSSGGTVALRPTAAGVEISATGQRGAGHLQDPESGWLTLMLKENMRTRTWSLSVGSQQVADGLPMATGASDVLSSLLVFADGSLDLDGLQVDLPSDAALAAGGGDATVGKSPFAAAFEAQDRSAWLSRAIEAAKNGDLALAAQIAAVFSRAENQTKGDALTEAHLLGIMAFALRDSGLHQPAAELGRLALGALGRTRTDSVEQRVSRRASIEFYAGQISEQLLGDWEGAERLYNAALLIDPTHRGAAGAAQEVRRKRDLGQSGGGQ